MAEKEVRYYREFANSKSGEVQTYDTLQAAIDDRNPRVRAQVYEMRSELLGEVKWTLVPIEKEKQAVRAELTLSPPKDKKK